MSDDAPRSLLHDEESVAAVPPLRDPEASFQTLERFLDERSRLVFEARHLHARFGPQGTFAEQREIVRAQLALEYRERMGGEGRLTQAMIDEAVRSDDRYVTLIQEAEDARARLYVMYDRIRQVNARIGFVFGPRVLHGEPTVAPPATDE
jgi:hypothetical protein